MKKILLFAVTATFLSSCYNRLGDLTVLSNRNFDRSEKYVLLQRDVTVKVKTKKKDAIERAVDKATNQANGEFIMNATLYVNPKGNKIKIKGDVWGLPPVTPTSAK